MPTINYSSGQTDSDPIVLTDNSTVLEVDNGTATQAGVISQSGGTFGITKTGAGTLILTANESYQGPTTISGGTLQVGNGGPIDNLFGSILDNGTLISNTSSFTQLVSISGSGNLIQNGSGILVLYEGNSFAGGTVVNSGSIWAEGIGALPGDITDNAQITFLLNVDFGSAQPITYSGQISGTGSIDFNGNRHSDPDSRGNLYRWYHPRISDSSPGRWRQPFTDRGSRDPGRGA